MLTFTRCEPEIIFFKIRETQETSSGVSLYFTEFYNYINLDNNLGSGLELIGICLIKK